MSFTSGCAKIAPTIGADRHDLEDLIINVFFVHHHENFGLVIVEPHVC